MIASAVQQRWAYLLSMLREMLTNGLILPANFEQKHARLAVGASRYQSVRGMQDQRALQRQDGIVNHGQPHQLSSVMHEDLLVGAAQTQGKYGVDVAQQRGTRPDEREKIGLRQCPQAAILFGAYRRRWRFACNERHLPKTLARPQLRHCQFIVILLQ